MILFPSIIVSSREQKEEESPVQFVLMFSLSHLIEGGEEE
jgi:hypothetical protein